MGQTFWNPDIMSNLLSDLYLIGVGGVIGLSIALYLTIGWNRRVASLMGLQLRKADVPVYLSSVTTHASPEQPGLMATASTGESSEGSGASVGADSQHYVSSDSSSNGYEGPLISLREVDSYIILRQMLEGPILRASGTLASTFQDRSRRKRAHAHILTSHAGDDLEIFDGGTLITLGTDKHNSVSGRLMRSRASFVRFGKDDRPGRVGCRTFFLNAERDGSEDNYSARLGRAEPGSGTESRNLGVIQRIFDKSSNRTYLQLCGIDATATFAAADYLSKNWRDLLSDYGPAPNLDFVILLKVEGSAIGEERRTQISGSVHASQIEAHRSAPIVQDFPIL